MKIVATYWKLSEASFAQSVLVGDGISAELQNVESSVNLIGGPPAINVTVPDSDEERARAVLESLTFSGPKADNPVKSSPMEFAVFRAIVKGIGVYQVVLGLTWLVTACIVAADTRHPSPSFLEATDLLRAAFHVGLGFILFWATDFVCRVALLSTPKSQKK